MLRQTFTEQVTGLIYLSSLAQPVICRVGTPQDDSTGQEKILKFETVAKLKWNLVDGQGESVRY